MDELYRIIETHFIHDKIIGNDLVVKNSFLLAKEELKKNKFQCFKKQLDNMFFSDHHREMTTNVFCNVQRFIHAIFRLKHIWKWKRAKLYNTDDLYMSPIHDGQKNTVTILQNNTKYVFHIRELIGSINNALSYSCHFFIEPLIIKNPYTNLPFHKSSLYTIYFAIRDSTFIMPILFHQYFLSGFNLSDFAIQNESIINKEYLRTYVDNNCTQGVYKQVKEMFYDHKLPIKINKHFPNDKLFDIMKPYLELYYSSTYSIHTYTKITNYRKLHKKLCEFIMFNPQFGRKKVKIVPESPFSKKKTIIYYYDDAHANFNQPINCSLSSKLFMNSHLCKEDFFNRNFMYRSVHHAQEEEDEEEENQEDEEEDTNTIVLEDSEEDDQENTNTILEDNEDDSEDDSEDDI